MGDCEHWAVERIGYIAPTVIETGFLSGAAVLDGAEAAVAISQCRQCGNWLAAVSVEESDGSVWATRRANLILGEQRELRP